MTTMKFLMMTMDTPTSRARRMMKMLKRLIKQEHLYTDEQLVEMKGQLRILEQELSDLDKKLSKGFGK